MTGFTNISARSALDSLISTYPYIGLLTVVGTDVGSGFTEVSGGSYARIATGSGDWSTVSGTGPSFVTNVFQLNFPESSGSWGTIIAWSLWDAPTSGNMGMWDFLGNHSWLPCTVSSASPGVMTAKTHGYSVSDSVFFTSEYGGTPPTFSQSNFDGILVVAHAATDTFDVTNASTQVNTNSTGSGMVRKVDAQAISSGANLSFGASTLTIVLA